MRTLVRGAWLVLPILSACGGGAPESPVPLGPVAWAEVETLFQDKCVRCHTGTEAATGLRLDDWTALMEGSTHGEAVIAGDAERSLLVELARELDHPGELEDAEPLTAEELATVARWIEGGAPSGVGEVPYADSRDLIYVTNQGSDVISVIEASAGVVMRTVDLAELGYGPSARPHHVAVEPDGSQWYTTLIGANLVLELNRLGRVIGSAPFETPGLLAVHPGADRLYVGRSMTAVNAPPRIGVIRPSDMTIEEVEVFFPRPHATAIAPGGAVFYTGSMSVNQLAAVAEDDRVEVVDVPGPAYSFMHFDVSPDGQTLVATTHTGELLLFSLADPMRPELTGSIRLGGMPWTPAYTPDGRYVFVTNNGNNTVAVVDMETRQVAETIRHPGLAEPYGIALSRDGRRAFVSGSNTDGSYTPRHALPGPPPGTVTIIDTQSFEVLRVLEVEQNPTGVGARRAY